MTCSCSFCGRRSLPSWDAGYVPIWRGRQGHEREFGICIHCLRTGIRALGELPDPTDGVVSLASYRAPVVHIDETD